MSTQLKKSRVLCWIPDSPHCLMIISPLGFVLDLQLTLQKVTMVCLWGQSPTWLLPKVRIRLFQVWHSPSYKVLQNHSIKLHISKASSYCLVLPFLLLHNHTETSPRYSTTLFWRYWRQNKSLPLLLVLAVTLYVCECPLSRPECLEPFQVSFSRKSWVNLYCSCCITKVQQLTVGVHYFYPVKQNRYRAPIRMFLLSCSRRWTRLALNCSLIVNGHCF